MSPCRAVTVAPGTNWSAARTEPLCCTARSRAGRAIAIDNETNKVRATVYRTSFGTMGLRPLRVHLRLLGLFGWIVHEPFLIDFLPVAVAERPSDRAIADTDGALTIWRGMSRTVDAT